MPLFSALANDLFLSLSILYHMGFNLSTPFSKIFGENWRGFVPLQTREERPLPLRISPLSNFLQPFAVLPHEAVAISQSGLYRALVAMSRLFVYRGVRSPLFCIYYSRWFAICQYFFQNFLREF